MHTPRTLTGELPHLDQAALALLGGRCAFRLGGEQGYTIGQAYFDRARELYEQDAQPEIVAIIIAEKAMPLWPG